MGMICWLKGHSYEDIESWEGNAFNIVKARVVYKKCTVCGKVTRNVHISGKLTKQAAESICTESNIDPDYIELKEIIKSPKVENVKPSKKSGASSE